MTCLLAMMIPTELMTFIAHAPASETAYFFSEVDMLVLLISFSFLYFRALPPGNLKPHTNCRPVEGRGLQSEASPLHPNMRPIWNRGSMSISIQINEEIPILPPPPSYSAVMSIQCALRRSSITYNVSEAFGAQHKR
jgi:hypothetical protein